jgi:hypothetical protein
MTESVSIAKTARVDPDKKVSGLEIVLRCVLCLLGIFLGVVVAFMIAAAIGWFRIDC